MVTQKEIIEALRNSSTATVRVFERQQLANRIEAEGIAPPDGDRAYVCRDCRAVYLEPNVTCDCLGVSGYDNAVVVMLAAAPKGVSHD